MAWRVALTSVFLSALCLGGSWGDGARAQDAFFKDKRLTFSVGFDPGSTYDASARMVARRIPRYLEGAPATLVRNMPGASSVRVTNYMYGVAPRDGTEMAVVNQGLPMSQALKETGVEFDAREFSWVGSPESGVNVAFSWHTSPVKTIQDATKQELVIGASGGGSATVFYPLMMNELLGTKFKIIRGYPSPELNLALERGEVHGRGAYTWSSLRATTTWVQEKKVNILVQMGASKAPELLEIPLMSELAHNEADRTLLEFVSAAPSVGRPFLLPPKVPPERVLLLRRAFDAVMKDADFLREAGEAKMEVNPTNGEELTKIVMTILNAPPEVIARTESFMKR